MATKAKKAALAVQPARLQAVHGWHGPEGVFEAGDPVPALDSDVEISSEREQELIDGGYVVALSAKEAQAAADAAQTDLPGQ